MVKHTVIHIIDEKLNVDEIESSNVYNNGLIRRQSLSLHL